MNIIYTCDDMYRILEREIISLAIKPGDILSENILCERFGVSRTPVRSVLQRLQEKELVQIKPYKGTIVTLLNFDIISQIIYQRVAVEGMIFRDFVNSCSAVEIEHVRNALYKMQEMLQTKHFDENQFYAADRAMHEIWFKSMRKMYLWESFEKAQSNYSRFRMLDIVATKNYEEIAGEHREMLQIIESKNTQLIEPLMQKHLNGGIKRLGRLIFTDYKSYFDDVSIN